MEDIGAMSEQKENENKKEKKMEDRFNPTVSDPNNPTSVVWLVNANTSLAQMMTHLANAKLRAGSSNWSEKQVREVVSRITSCEADLHSLCKKLPLAINSCMFTRDVVGFQSIGFLSSHCSPTITLSNHNMTAIATSGNDKWERGVLCSKPNLDLDQCYVFTTKLVKTKYSSIMIGFAPLSLSLSEVEIYKTRGHFYHANDGTLYGGQNTQGKPYGVALQSGECLTATYDTERKTIAFSVNGRGFGVAYQNLTEDLYPAVLFYNVGDEVTLVT